MSFMGLSRLQIIILAGKDMVAPVFELDPIVIALMDEQFEELCRNNRDLRFEQTATGELIIMPPTGWETGNRNSELTYEVQAWSRKTKTGKAFDSSTGFTLYPTVPKDRQTRLG
jgi:Uma2 family endonuclease